MIRTHEAGTLRGEHAGEQVVLAGWVARRRDHGGVIFLDLRDASGVVQVVWRSDEEAAHDLRAEFCVRVTGEVRLRPAGNENPELPTGVVEVVAAEVEVLSEAEPLPFPVEGGTDISEDIRIKYRYLDIRREETARNLRVRSTAAYLLSDVMRDHGFVNVETPYLTRSTPEGARDFLVPVRLRPGNWYALPQSPQLFKQLLMVGGLERYYQLARCFRDEDFRKDRQPEFTQIDLEMSFVTEDDVFSVVEGTLGAIFRRDLNRELRTPFPRITYDEAMARFGSDKPDLRIPFEIKDVTEVAGQSAFEVFRAAKAGAPKTATLALAVPGLASASRREIDGYEASAKQAGAPGLAWARVKGSSLDGGVAKHIAADLLPRLLTDALAKDGDLLLFASGPRPLAQRVLGLLRTQIGNAAFKLDDSDHRFVWVHRFPLFEWVEGRSCWGPAHHIFTMPLDEDLPYIESDPGRVRAQLYDLAANGNELASGSIRIHRKDIQESVMRTIGMKSEEAHTKFGFLLEAFEYGAPPHGGIALGLDRLVILFNGGDSIRDAIAFPKTASATSLMDGAPAPIDPADLRELRIRLDP